MTGWWLVPLAFFAMAVQDVLGSVMVQAEAQGRALTAAACDTAQDACVIASLVAIGDSLIVGNDFALSAAVIGARLSADFGGTYAGVRIGSRLMRRPA